MTAPGGSAVTRFLQVHAQVMNQAFELLRGGPATAAPPAPATMPPPATTPAPATTAEPDAASDVPGAPAPTVPAAGGWPLSRIQRELWLLDRLGPDYSRAYWEGVLIDLRGQLDLAAMRSAVAGVLARHDVLHAVIDPDGSGQRTVPEVPDVTVADFTGKAGPDQARQLAAWHQVRAMEVPDLSSRPPVRAVILRIAERHHQLYLGVHHAMIDGWSFDVVLSEVAAGYEGAVSGRPAALPAPVQYREHVAWERRREAGPAFQDSLRYWREQFADGIPVPALPSALPSARPSAGGRKLGVVRHPVEADVAAQLPGMAARAGVTEFTVLLGAYGHLLHQLCGQADLVIGVPFARRGYPGGERVVGNCATTIPVRSRADGAATVGDYLRALRGTLAAAHEHPDFSIASLRDRVPMGDGAGGQVFAVLFNLDRAAGLPSPGGLQVSVSAASRMFAKAALVFDILIAERDIWLTAEYNADIIEPAVAQAYARAYGHVLRRFVAGPAEQLSQVRLTDDGDLCPADGAGSAAEAAESAQAAPGEIEAALWALHMM